MPLTTPDLDDARRRVLATIPSHLHDHGARSDMLALVNATLYVGDCIRYQAETALFIAEHRTIDPRSH